MANQEHLDFLKQGVEVWNQWREENPDIHPDLSRLSIGLSRLRAVYRIIELETLPLWRAGMMEAGIHSG